MLNCNVPDERIPMTADDADLVAAAIQTGTCKGLIPDAIGEPMPDIDRVTEGGPELVRTLRSIVSRYVATRP